MALFRFTTSEPEAIIRGHGIMMRRPRADDYEAWALLRAQSKDFLAPWEPVWPSDDLSRSGYRRRLKRYDDEIRLDHAYPFLIFTDDGKHLIGGLTLGQVRRGVAQSGTLGYWIGSPFAGKGYMTSAVTIILRYAFDTLKLHRVEAAVMPENLASLRVLEKAGFRHEGFAPDYLCIAGHWRDHILLGMLAWEYAARNPIAGQSSVDGDAGSSVQAAPHLLKTTWTDTTNFH
jgi:[ribosomal protein S5]-alanine N-acetyltransferase